MASEAPASGGGRCHCLGHIAGVRRSLPDNDRGTVRQSRVDASKPAHGIAKAWQLAVLGDQNEQQERATRDWIRWSKSKTVGSARAGCSCRQTEGWTPCQSPIADQVAAPAPQGRAVHSPTAGHHVESSGRGSTGRSRPSCRSSATRQASHVQPNDVRARVAEPSHAPSELLAPICSYAVMPGTSAVDQGSGSPARKRLRQYP